MLAAVATFALEGVRSHEVTVEVDVRPGLSIFTLVGLPDRAVRESRERVRAALLNSGLDFPHMRLTVNLAPAHVRKAGPSFDLAIAVGVLAASDQVPAEALEDCAVCGELSLSGELRPVRGALAAALGARRAGYDRLLVPEANAPEAALVEGVEVYGIPTLARLAELLHDRWAPGGRQTCRAGHGGNGPGPGSRRRSWTGGRQAGARDRRRRRTQRPDDRASRGRQDHARTQGARHPAAADV
jgi:magnesium chelatase family protein